MLTRVKCLSLKEIVARSSKVFPLIGTSSCCSTAFGGRQLKTHVYSRSLQLPNLFWSRQAEKCILLKQCSRGCKTTAHVLKDDDTIVTEKKSLSKPPTAISHYLKLSKARLSGLVVLTAMAGYAVAPGAFHVLPFAGVIAGTALCSAAANSLNQFLEIPYDSQMARTRNRVLVQGLLRPMDAVMFGAVSSAAGILILGTMTNELTAALGALNILLYVCVYTPSKRMSIINTWLGSAVGAIPPLMGWAACTGAMDVSALLLGAVLYCWQFPHFNALSWNYRQDYSRAGYRMMAVTDPALCRRVALRHTLAQIPLCALLPLFGATNWWLLLESLPLNGYFAWLAWRFYQRSDNKSARDLFRFSLIHLPLLLLLILINSKRRDKEPHDAKCNDA